MRKIAHRISIVIGQKVEQKFLEEEFLINNVCDGKTFQIRIDLNPLLHRSNFLSNDEKKHMVITQTTSANPSSQCHELLCLDFNTKRERGRYFEKITMFILSQ